MHLKSYVDNLKSNGGFELGWTWRVTAYGDEGQILDVIKVRSLGDVPEWMYDAMSQSPLRGTLEKDGIRYVWEGYNAADPVFRDQLHQVRENIRRLADIFKRDDEE